jgi:hypothetical protein
MRVLVCASIRYSVASTMSTIGRRCAFDSIFAHYNDWEHKIKLEKTLPFDPEMKHPRCIAGQYACPPEDVGGVAGYIDFLDAIRNPAHEEHASMLEWIGGGFDPLTFDLDETNERLSEIKL